ncbi:MAG: cobalamin-dependent protein, partial [Planctomycetes bacterium]|nr:cobalamin-dependent protein [Planctomycetota bacterium]
SNLLEELVTALKRYDTAGVEEGLSRAAISLSRPHLIEQVLVPLVQRIGDLWHDGTLRVAHEHLATSIIRSFVGHLDSASQIPAGAPCMIVTTPTSQAHELGALIAAATAFTMGWKVLYLGPNLPAEEICAAAEHNRAQAVAISIVYPPDDPHLREELNRLQRLLPESTSLIVGGRAAASYYDVLKKGGAVFLQDMGMMREYLATLI